MNRTMSLLSVFSAIAVVLTISLMASIASGTAPAQIIIQDADTSFTSSMQGSDALDENTQTVRSRFVTEYAQVITYFDLDAAPTELLVLAQNVSPRNLIRHAKTNRTYALGYPLELIDDSAPPAITALSVTEILTDTATIVWLTDEPADSLVRYGLQPSQYTQSVQDPLFLRGHGITLTNLTPDTRYYFIVQSTDQSGNMAESAEQTFRTASPTSFIYMPTIRR